MKKKTFSLSVSGEMGAGKDRPPALPKIEGVHEDFLTEIMERMERMEATNRKVKLLTDIEERVAKLEEAAAIAAAPPAWDSVTMSAEEAAMVRAIMAKTMEGLFNDAVERWLLAVFDGDTSGGHMGILWRKGTDGIGVMCLDAIEARGDRAIAWRTLDEQGKFDAIRLKLREAKPAEIGL